MIQCSLSKAEKSKNAENNVEYARFAAAYHRYYPEILKYIAIQRRTRREDAEDIAQDIFTKLWERRDLLQNIISWENYLFLSVRNRLINEDIKLQSRQKRLEKFWVAHVWHSRPVEEWISYREISGLYHETIRLLPERGREAYLLKHQVGLSDRNIARAMNISRTTAKQHLVVASKKVRHHIEKKYR
jgi:RNA polymerase sigma-70 factor, ECF subfamily